tara:strand:- start:168 stop:407 length:240 start_codon:yes stop_codon:yes gene_type:complete
MKKKLTRVSDKLSRKGIIKFLEFGPQERGVKLHLKPKKGYACIVNPQRGVHYTWMTSAIVEVISPTEFKTNNSHYKITK